MKRGDKMINLSDKEEVMHKENIKRLNSEYENIDGLYREKLEHYKNSRVRKFIPIFVMRDVLGSLKASLNQFIASGKFSR